eukprot:491170_1
MAKQEKKEGESITILIDSFFKKIQVVINRNAEIECIKKEIEDKEGISSSEQLVKYKGKFIDDKKTLKDYKIDDGAVLFLSAKLKAGGRGLLPGILGPDMDSQKYFKRLKTTGLSPFNVCKGLNIYFLHPNGQEIVGKLGFGKFDMARDYKKAYNKYYDIHCPSLSRVKKCLFWQCKVCLEGEEYDTGKAVHRQEKFTEENKLLCYVGQMRYAWLTLKVVPLSRTRSYWSDRD